MARGSVFRKDGCWGFRVDAGFHSSSGKRRQILRQGFATKRAAEVALAELAGEANCGLVVSRSSMTVGEYLVEWFESARASLRPTTSRGYEQAIVRLTTNLGRVRLQALTPMQVQRCYTDLLESGGRDGKPLAPKTVRHAHVVLPDKVVAEFLAVLHAVAAAPPPAFSGGGKWEAMHGEMSGFYEVRVQGAGMNHRLFCVLERHADDLGGPSIVLIDGLSKPKRSAANPKDYRRALRIRAEFAKHRTVPG